MRAVFRAEAESVELVHGGRGDSGSPSMLLTNPKKPGVSARASSDRFPRPSSGVRLLALVGSDVDDRRHPDARVGHGGVVDTARIAVEVDGLLRGE